jgi:hypothetical protein
MLLKLKPGGQIVGNPGGDVHPSRRATASILWASKQTTADYSTDSIYNIVLFLFDTFPMISSDFAMDGEWFTFDTAR